MDEGGGEYVHDFRQHIFEEGIHLLVARTEIGLLVGLVRTGEFGIGREHLFAMGRHFDFGNDGDAALGRIGHEFTQFGLRIVATVGSRCALFEVVAVAVPPLLPQGVGAPGGKLRQSRVFLDFHAPAGCVGQMKVEAVELKLCQHVHLLA